MYLLPFLTCTDRLDLVGIIDCLVQYIDHVISFLICGLEVSLLVVGAGSSLGHAKGVHLVVIL